MLLLWLGVSLSFATRSPTSPTPDELAEPESLCNACPSVFAWNGGDAAGKPVGVPGELGAGSLARPAVLSTTTRCHVVPGVVPSVASLPPGSVARPLVLFTSHPTFDTIPAPSSDAILVPWATSRTRRYYAVADWRTRLPATTRADRHSSESTSPSGGRASRRDASIAVRETFLSAGIFDLRERTFPPNFSIATTDTFQLAKRGSEPATRSNAEPVAVCVWNSISYVSCKIHLYTSALWKITKNTRLSIKRFNRHELANNHVLYHSFILR